MSHIRMKHFAAMMLIGDGIMAMVRPRQDAAAWAHGPWIWRKSMNGMRKHPAVTRMVGLAQVVGGLCWLLRNEELSSAKNKLAA